MHFGKGKQCFKYKLKNSNYNSYFNFNEVVAHLVTLCQTSQKAMQPQHIPYLL